MDLPVMPPVSPMLAKSVPEIPTGDFLYEPKWDGFRSIVFRDGDEVEIGSRNEQPMTRYFPEVVEAVLANLPERCVVDGEIVVVDRRGPARLRGAPAAHPPGREPGASCSRSRRRRSFVAFDLLALGDDDLTRRAVRRAARACSRRRSPTPQPPIHLTPATTDRERRRALVRPSSRARGSTAWSPSRSTGTYQPDKRDDVQDQARAHRRLRRRRLPRAQVRAGRRSARCCSASTTTTARCASVGVIGAFPMARRRELFDGAAAAASPTFDDHPWDWAEAGGGRRARPASPRAAAGTPARTCRSSRCAPSASSRSRYDHMEGERFRHTAQFVRWRPDRDPALVHLRAARGAGRLRPRRRPRRLIASAVHVPGVRSADHGRGRDRGGRVSG